MVKHYIVKVSAEEEWIADNFLHLKFIISGKVTWSGGSLYNHAAFLGIKNEKITISKYID